MFNGAAVKIVEQEKLPESCLVGWVAASQAAKKGLSHSPYVTCFPNASAVRICSQHAPADQLAVLNCICFHTSPGFPFPPDTDRSVLPAAHVTET